MSTKLCQLSRRSYSKSVQSGASSLQQIRNEMANVLNNQTKRK